ncbi:hypothetical protein QO232_23070, partial [Vibrio vulnificus]
MGKRGNSTSNRPQSTPRVKRVLFVFFFKYLTDERQGAVPKSAKQILESGQQIWVREISTTDKDGNTINSWKLSQVPSANT